MTSAETILRCGLHAVLVLVLAPFAEGVRRRLTARVQSRQGPPLVQPWLDLGKLLGKEDLEVGGPPGMQRFAALLALVSVLAVACFIPFGDAVPLDRAGDALVLVALLTLCSVCTLLAGLAAGSVYSLLGVGRELATLMVLEPLLAVGVLAAAAHAQSLRLETVLRGGLYEGPGVPWAGLLLLVVGLLALPAFAQRSPFDVAEAETELMDGPLLEYSGPKLALLRFAHMARLLVGAALVVTLYLPWGESWPRTLALPFFWLKVLAVVVFVSLVAATHARHRIDAALRRLVALLGLGLGGLTLAALGL